MLGLLVGCWWLGWSICLWWIDFGWGGVGDFLVFDGNLGDWDYWCYDFVWIGGCFVVGYDWFYCLFRNLDVWFLVWLFRWLGWYLVYLRCGYFEGVSIGEDWV